MPRHAEILRRLLLALLLAAISAPAFAAACTTGQTTCNTDTVNDAAITAAMRDGQVQQRVYELWLGQCFNNVWGEAASTAGHLRRINFCNQIVSGSISKEALTAMIMTSIVQGEILGTCAIPVGTPAAAGCMADIDVTNAISTLLNVTLNTATTTATAAISSTVLTVASATGIVNGMNTYAAGIPAGAIVTNVSGTSVSINLATTAALSATTILFTISTGLP